MRGIVNRDAMRASAVACEVACREMLAAFYGARGCSARERLGLLDRVSQRLCETVDRAEMLRCVHPSDQTRREADDVFGVLSNLIATLNTSPQLYEATAAVCDDGAATSEDEEERRVSSLYRVELEAHGAHLSEPGLQERVVELQNGISALSHQFAVGQSEALEELLTRRRELARLLGFDSYAEYVMSSRVMRSVPEVNALLDRLEALLQPPRSKRRALAQQPEVSLEQLLYTLSRMTEEVLGLEVTEVRDFEDKWHPSVTCLAIGSRGLVYLDLLQREGKVPQPCTFQLRFDVGNTRGESGLGGGRNVSALVASVADPRNLAPYEVESLFHEWGHTLASVCSDTRYQQLAGTRAALDFVETPSMLFERLAWHPLALPKWGNVKHVAEMREQWRASLFHETRVQLVQARNDLRLHGASFEVPQNSTFVHLGPYGAGYYSYLVCKVFAANLERLCLGESLSGGAVLRDKLLRFGGARDPLAMVRDCTGRDPFDLTAFHQ